MYIQTLKLFECSGLSSSIFISSGKAQGAVVNREVMNRNDIPWNGCPLRSQYGRGLMCLHYSTSLIFSSSTQRFPLIMRPLIICFCILLWVLKVVNKFEILLRRVARSSEVLKNTNYKVALCLFPSPILSFRTFSHPKEIESWINLKLCTQVNSISQKRWLPPIPHLFYSLGYFEYNWYYLSYSVNILNLYTVSDTVLVHWTDQTSWLKMRKSLMANRNPPMRSRPRVQSFKF